MTTLREAAQQALEALENCRIEYDYHGNPIDEENANLLKSIDTLRAALAAPRPEPGPEPATDAKLLLAYRQRGCGFYMEFREIWQAAERFHGITKEDKT